MNQSDPFGWIESQTSKEDREALLSLKRAIGEICDRYDYLEIGSHLGGSLQPHIGDPRCARIYSIDPRPKEQPDERLLSTFKYEGNSTERMLEHLRQVPGADLNKLVTFEANSWDLAADAIPRTVNLAFIDGEHTNTAVSRDFAAVRRFLTSPSLLAFHDCYVTPRALRMISASERTHENGGRFFYFPESNVVALVFADRDVRLANRLSAEGWRAGLPPMWLKSVRLKWSSRLGELKARVKSSFPGLLAWWRRLRKSHA